MRLTSFALLLFTACTRPEPHAGVITDENQAEVVPHGERAGGRPGDFFLRNGLATYIVQRPVREVQIGPFGGSLIDATLAGAPDRFGELVPVLALGRTVRIDDMRVVSDGSDGGDAVVEGHGVDATNIYYNVKAISTDLAMYDPSGAGILGHDPEQSLGLAVRVVYRLPAHEARLSVTYTFTNTGAARQGVPLAFLVDSGGNVEAFQPGPGYVSPLSQSFDAGNFDQLLLLDQPSEQSVYFASDVAIGFVPRALGDKRPPRVIGATIPGLGGVMLFGARNVAAAFKDSSFTLRPGERIDVTMDVLVSRSPDEALARGWDLIGQPLAPIDGCVTLTSGGPAAGVRVGFTNADDRVTGTFVTDAAGCFRGRLPPGDYRAVAGYFYRPPSAEVAAQVPGSVQLSLAPLARIEARVGVYDQLDSLSTTARPCRMTLVGARASVRHSALGADPIDDAGGVVYRHVMLRDCAGGLDVPPGRYLAIVTRGPEFDRLEQVVDATAGITTTVSGALHRVVDTSNYAASDFHVHSVYSSDSRVPATDRVLSLASEAMDFWASTDHDMVVDFTPHIAELGLENQLLTIPGSEVTTFDTGHFGAYPLPVDRSLQNGGSPDWGVRDNGIRPPMQELFDTIHERGALVQVNHPRSGGMAMMAYFSRAGVRYDPYSGRPFADPTRQIVDSGTLRFGPGVIYYSDDFDIIEVMNGTGTYVSGAMTYDRGVESVGHDWMNMLTAGYRVTGVANSDTHTLGSLPGVPRTLVGGHDRGLPGLLAALSHGDAVLSTGPMLRATLSDASGQRAGLGDTLSPTSRTVTLEVEVETPLWFRVDAVEVIGNVFFADPTTGELPVSAAPLVMLQPVEVTRPNGGKALVASVTIPLDLDAPPFAGGDAWIAVRAGGSATPLFPVTPGGGSVDTNAATPDTFLRYRSGVLPFAMTNPIYVDSDRDGRWLPSPAQ